LQTHRLAAQLQETLDQLLSERGSEGAAVGNHGCSDEHVAGQVDLHAARGRRNRFGLQPVAQLAAPHGLSATHLCLGEGQRRRLPADLLAAQAANQLLGALQLHAAQRYVRLQMLLLGLLRAQLGLHGRQLVQQALRGGWLVLGVACLISSAGGLNWQLMMISGQHNAPHLQLLLLGCQAHHHLLVGGLSLAELGLLRAHHLGHLPVPCVTQAGMCCS
jgi:hypothetical protein